MTKLIKSIFKFFKIIYLIIISPFLLIKYTYLLFKTLFKAIYKQFMKLFKFSLSFKISFIYFFITTTILFFISTFIIISLKYVLIEEVNHYAQKDKEILKEYITNNDKINKNELKTYLSLKNNITIKEDNSQIYVYNKSDFLFDLPKEAYNFILKINIPLNLTYTNTINEEVNIKDKNYNFIIESNFNDYLIFLKLTAIILAIISSILIFLTLILSTNTTKKMFQPIYEMTNSAKKINSKNLKHRVHVTESFDELKELENTLNNMLERIEKSYEKQKVFVNDASHELRTPLAVIQGYSNMLDRWGKDNKEILLESIEAIQNEAKQMTILIENLLFLARADKNTKNLKKENFNVNKLLNEVVKETQIIKNTKNIKNISKEDYFISADRNLIKQALRIFIENSIKYTEENGKIILNSYEEENFLIITIKDNGIGIKKEDLKYIFDRFYRADTSRTKKTGGTGLGLSIAKWIIDSHNAQINVKSAISIGTKFFIKFPFKK